MICTPITASTVKEALDDIREAKDADLIELRLDLINDISLSNLHRLIENKKKKVIVTDRKNRLDMIRKAIELNSDFIDVDISMGEKTIKEIILHKNSSKIIVSFHDFKKTDISVIKKNYEKMASLGPDIIKIATFANDISDNKVIFDLIKDAKKENKRIIALCMGEKGEISRIIGPIFGSFITFGSLEKGKESAPGQVTAEKLKNIYRVDDLKDPKIFGLVGNPVSESRGYLIHNKSFNQLSLNNIYINFLVDNIGSFIGEFKDFFEGLSITMPFKEKVMSSLDKIDPTTEKIGAVNTIVKDHGNLIGYNTDYIGAIKAIENVIDIKGKNIFMLGAGGVAKAIAHGINEKKGNLFIFDIDKEKASQLAKKSKSHVFDDLNLIPDKADIVINATPVGMFPNVQRSPLAKEFLKKNMVVFDCIYNPIKTKLLSDADHIGCKTISGIELFINQAIAQFELWTKKKAPRHIFEEVLL
ncbi:MAG: shikimate dehydrogenase [Nanoarchaeota archaeon]